jgi:hypothetical protein
VPATYGNFLSNILVTYFGDRLECGDLLFGFKFPFLAVIETDEIWCNRSRFYRDKFRSQITKIFASRLRMTEKKLQGQ